MDVSAHQIDIHAASSNALQAPYQKLGCFRSAIAKTPSLVERDRSCPHKMKQTQALPSPVAGLNFRRVLSIVFLSRCDSRALQSVRAP